MKPIVFDTVIDKKRYVFEVFQVTRQTWGASAYTNDRYVDFASSDKSEEDAILKLVKLLEK